MQRAGELALSQGRDPAHAVVAVSAASPWENTGTFYRLRWSEALTGRFNAQAQRVADIARAPGVVRGPNYAPSPVHVIIDATGLGAPLAEEVQSLGVPVVALVWTAFAGLTAAHNSVSKARAFGLLRLIIDKGRLEIAGDLPDRETLASELGGLRLETSENGYQTIRSLSGAPDDFASSLCLALVYSEVLGSTDPNDWPTVRLG
jgi:hypothetical protein